MQETSIFQRKGYMVLFALTAVLAWSFAVPLIKLGMIQFNIDNSDTGSKMVFAGIRFFTAGIVTFIIARVCRRGIIIKEGSKLAWVLLLGLVNTALHYFCFYIGVSNSPGSRSAIIDSMGTFILVVMACIAFKDEHMTKKKVLGCVLGISGILAANAGKNMGGSFTLNGDGMLILNAFVSASGGVLTRVVTKKADPITATGYSLSFGGFLLFVGGKLMGGSIDTVTALGILILIALISISVVGFTLYNQLLCYNPVGNVAIFNALLPVFGTVISCILLGEEFRITYVFGLVLISSGIYIVNRGK